MAQPPHQQQEDDLKHHGPQHTLVHRDGKERVINGVVLVSISGKACLLYTSQEAPQNSIPMEQMQLTWLPDGCTVTWDDSTYQK